jgi:hypothetical protein
VKKKEREENKKEKVKNMNNSKKQVDETQVIRSLYADSKREEVRSTKTSEQILKEAPEFKNPAVCLNAITLEGAAQKGKIPPIETTPLETLQAAALDDIDGLKHQMEFVKTLSQDVQEKFLTKPDPGEIYIRLKPTNPFSRVKPSLANNKRKIQELEATEIQGKESVPAIRKRLKQQKTDLTKKFRKVTEIESSLAYSISHVDQETGLAKPLPWFDVVKAGNPGEGDRVISQTVSEFTFEPVEIAGFCHQARARYRFFNDERFLQQ